MEYLLLALSIVAASGKALFGKELGRGASSIEKTLFQNFQAFAVAFVCSVLFTIRNISSLFLTSSFTLILALIFSLFVAVTQITQSKAMAKGASSLVSIIYSFGFILPIFYSAIMGVERISVMQIVGLTLLVCSLILITGKKKEKKSRNFAWLILSFVAMLGSGTNAIIQKIHQSSSQSVEIEQFLVLAMFFSALFTLLSFFVVKITTKKKTDEVREKMTLRSFLVSLGLGVCVFALNFVNLYLAGKLPSVVQFPVYNVGNLALTTVVSAFIFKDKTTKIQNIGLCVGIVSILIIGLL